MEDTRRQLSEAYGKAARYRRVNALLGQLRADIKAQEQRIKDLESMLEKVNGHAEKLEAGGVVVALSRLLGTHEAQVEQAQADYFAARLKYEEAVNALEQIRRNIEGLEMERISLEGSEEAYAELYAQKIHMLMRSGSNTEFRTGALFEEIEQIKANLREIGEAAEAGNIVARHLDCAYEELDRAGDCFGRGSGLERMDRIETAKCAAQDAQAALDNFNAQLADIRVFPAAGGGGDTALRFAELFFDGLVLDWFKLDRLERSLENVEKARADVLSTLERLKDKAETEQARLRSLEDELLVLVMDPQTNWNDSESSI